jgi:membrane-associated phospholipid phosphatase
MGDDRSNRPPFGWAPELVLLLAAAGVTLLLLEGHLDLDWAVHDWVAANQTPLLWWPARALNFAGSANLLAAVAVVLAAPTVVRERSLAALTPVATALLLSYAVIGPIKLWTDRAAPSYPAWSAADLFAHPDGWSFPSGHVVNAIIWYRVLLHLTERLLRRPLSPRTRHWVRVAPVLTVCWTVTYLNYHWLTDTVVGVLLGLLLERLLSRADRLPAAWPATRATARPEPRVPV